MICTRRWVLGGEYGFGGAVLDSGRIHDGKQGPNDEDNVVTVDEEIQGLQKPWYLSNLPAIETPASMCDLCMAPLCSLSPLA